MGWRDVAVVVAILGASVVAGCDGKPAAAPTEPAPQAEAKPLEFNTQDKAIMTNGNVGVAAARLRGEPAGSCGLKGETISAAALTKSPYSSLGKVIKMTGQVFKVEELPPDAQRAGKWGEILLLARNPNNAVGVTTIDFIYNGDISKINSGQKLTCAGYFIGTFESENAMGGKVESVVLVGDAVKM